MREIPKSTEDADLWRNMGKLSFGKREKIRKRRDYVTIYQQGVRLYSDHFIIVVHRNNVGLKRLGITVTKKVGNAVKRNRIKRLIREFFRRNKVTLRDSQDVVIIAKRALPALTYGDVYGELERLLLNKTDA
jgi:ribonuclease P protein component